MRKKKEKIVLRDNSEHKSKYDPQKVKLMPPLDGIVNEIHDRLAELELKYGYMAESLGVKQGKIFIRGNK